LASNGTGFALEYDPKNMFVFRFGLQQSNPDATSLSDSIYSLSEVAATVTPFSLPEGHYRFWFRANNGDVESKKAVGVSLDQKITPIVSLFGRYGTQDLEGTNERDDPSRRRTLEGHHRQPDDIGANLRDQPLNRAANRRLDQDEIGDGDSMMRVNISGERGERAVRHADGQSWCVLE